MTGTPGYKDAVGWVNLGWIYRNLNKAAESIAAYQKALQLDPKQEQAALGLGWAYQYTKEYDKAIAAYEQAMKIDPKDASADANARHRLVLLLQAASCRKAKAYADKAAAAGPQRHPAQGEHRQAREGHRRRRCGDRGADGGGAEEEQKA